MGQQIYQGQCLHIFSSAYCFHIFLNLIFFFSLNTELNMLLVFKYEIFSSKNISHKLISCNNL